MNAGQEIVGLIYSHISSEEGRRLIISRITFNFEFLIVWNENSGDYCFIKVVLFPSKKEIYNKEKELVEEINISIREFMDKRIYSHKDAFVFYFNSITFKMNMSFKKIMKKHIIQMNEKKKKDKFVDQEILSMLHDAGTKGMSLSEITQKTQSITCDERKKILDELLLLEAISMKFDTSNGRQKKMFYYD